jgi:SNF2 family DNA or RNA helicase
MFCAHPFLITEDRGDLAEASTKYYRLIEIISELASSGEKALIFTSFNKMADNIESDVASRLGIYTDFIDGRVPVVERQGKIDTFSSHKGPAILVLNPRAAGTGLNITSANHVIHYNLEWNPAVEDQASARAYRLGQTRPVTIHRLFFIDTVEEVIDQRLDLKRDLAEAVIVGTDGHTDQEDMIRALQISPAGRRLNE